MQTGRNDHSTGSATYSAADSAEFEITSYRGTLSMVGHTRSRAHEQLLLVAAESHFPSHTTRVDFRPLGVAPSWWDGATIHLIALLEGMKSPAAYLTQDALRVQALVTDMTGAEERLRKLRRALPNSMAIDTQFVAVDASATANKFCELQFAAFQPGSVAFEESETEMRTSAYPVLDRVVALADACREATITITGHTDSTGNEGWNQQLSLARAKAVTTYLNSRGITAERLVAVGAGSSLPIADNASRYGRGKNRRIDIVIRPLRPQPHQD